MNAELHWFQLNVKHGLSVLLPVSCIQWHFINIIFVVLSLHTLADNTCIHIFITMENENSQCKFEFENQIHTFILNEYATIWYPFFLYFDFWS